MKKIFIVILFYSFICSFTFGFYNINFFASILDKVENNNVVAEDLSTYSSNIKKKIDFFTKIEISVTKIVIFGNKIGYDTENLMQYLLMIQKLRLSYFNLLTDIYNNEHKDYKTILKNYNYSLVGIVVSIKAELKILKRYLYSNNYTSDIY